MDVSYATIIFHLVIGLECLLLVDFSQQFLVKNRRKPLVMHCECLLCCMIVYFGWQSVLWRCEQFCCPNFPIWMNIHFVNCLWYLEMNESDVCQWVLYFVLQTLLQELLTSCDGQLKAEVTQIAAFYEHRLQLGQKAIYHLEAFVVKFMTIYKRFLEDGILEDFDDEDGIWSDHNNSQHWTNIKDSNCLVCL